MPREKKKWNYQELERHTVIWATDRLDEMREMAARINEDAGIIEEEKLFIFQGLSCFFRTYFATQT